jgi:hypothetical protein
MVNTDIENCHIIKKFCHVSSRDCQYNIGKNCIHPIHNYLLLRVETIEKESKSSVLINYWYDIDMVFTIKQINQIINIIYIYDIFDYHSLYSSIYYMEIFIQKNNIRIHVKNIYILWFLSIMISSKFLSDEPYSNKTFSILFGIELSVLNQLEINYLKNINFGLHRKNLANSILKIKQEITIYQNKNVCDCVVPFNEWGNFQKKYHSYLL